MSKASILVLLLLIGLGGVLFLYLDTTSLRRNTTNTIAKVNTSVPVPEKTVIAAIEKLFGERGSHLQGKFTRFSFARVGDEYFPNQYQIEQTPPVLKEYLAIDPSLKKNDVYLYDFSDADSNESYWFSEYEYNGKPAKFRCNFLIHLEPDGTSGTEITVFEYAPRVWIGKKFGFGRHGPGFFLNIESVEPTTQDRLELLTIIKDALQ
jgi:hypothetical protein